MFFSGATSSSVGGRLGSVSGNGDRGSILGKRYQPFANPFFDQASTYTPPTIKALFGFCRFYFLTNGAVNAVVTRASEYPVTDLIIQDKDEGVRTKWEEMMLGIMNYRVHQYEINIDLNCYGNAFVSVSFPFRKKIVCANCRAEHDALQARTAWRYLNSRFWLQCDKCGQTDFATSKDVYYPSASDIGLIRWNPEYIQVFYNETTGRLDYGLDIPPDVRSQVMMGRKDLIATTPEIFLEAIRTKRQLVFDRSEVFHMRRPSLSSYSRGWGIPMLMPVLKDAFLLQVLRKAQEAICLVHLTPQVFLYPQPSTAAADPFCVSPNTLVESITGLRPASEVRKGDLLRDHTGRWRQVEALARRKVPKGEKVYEITPYTLAGFPFRVSEEHPIFATKATKSVAGLPELSFVDAKDLSVGDYVAYPIQREVRDRVVDVGELCPEFVKTDDWVYVRLDQQGAEIFEYFEKNGVPSFRPGEKSAFLAKMGWNIERFASVKAMRNSAPTRYPRYISINKDWATILGYYLSEGHTTQCQTGFVFHTQETQFVEELIAALGRVGHAASVRSNGPNCRTVIVEGVVFASILRALCGGLSAYRKIPEVLAEAQDEICWEMLRCLYNGFIASDKRNTSRVSLKTVSPNLAIEARRLLLSFGFISGVSKAIPKPDERAKQPYYQVYCNGTEGDRLAKAFGWSGYREPTERQSTNAFIKDGYLYMRIRSIKEVEEPEVIGFQMEGKTFCVAGVATHNSLVDLQSWRDHIRRELARQRTDPAYYGILPFPLGHQVINENGRALLLMPEIQQLTELIVTGMGFPIDLVFGHGTYAGTSVSMRMLENFFMSNVMAHKRLLAWVMKRIGAFMNWPVPDGKFKPFRMADDLQRQGMMLQLNAAGKVSDATLLSFADLKVEDESELMLGEARIKAEASQQRMLVDAEAQGEAQMVLAKYQARAQAAGQTAMARELAPRRSPFDELQNSAASTQPQGYSLDAVGAALAQKIKTLPPDQQAAYISQLKVQAPEALDLAAQQIQIPGVQAQGQPMPQAPVDMRPMPEQLPPRRAGMR